MQEMYMKIASALIMSLAAGSIASAQTPQPVRVGGYGKINYVRIGDKVFHPKQGVVTRAPVLVYDNWPAAGGFPFYSGGVNRVLDKMSLTPGPAAGGSVALTSLDTFGVAAPASDPGGTFDSVFKVYNTVDEAATTGNPVNTGQLGQTITINATVGPNPFGTQGAVVWLFLPVDITTAGITIPDDDFGVSQEVFLPTTTTLSTTYLPNFNGQPFPPAVGNSGDFFYWDANFDETFTADPNERYVFNTTTQPFFANLLLKLTGEVSTTTGCYADCDLVGGLTANDFICFLTAFNQNQSYADCDGIGGLTANDFICFVTAYNTGCS
jgi:hypothetical protein